MAGTSEATKYSPLAETNHNRRTFAGGDDLVRVAAAKHGQRKNAAKFLHRLADSVFQIAVEILFDQVGNDFRIGLSLENVAFPAATALSAGR